MRENFAEAKSWFEKALKLHTDMKDPDRGIGYTYEGLAACCIKLGDTAGFISHADKAIELGAATPEWKEQELRGAGL